MFRVLRFRGLGFRVYRELSRRERERGFRVWV